MVSKSNILLVDDDAGVSDMVGGLLGDAGYNVTKVVNAEQVRDTIDTEAFDLVLIDPNLSDSDGLALVSDIVSMKSMALIIVSDRTAPVDRVIGLELGADDYITKPFVQQELLARVRSVMRRLARSRSEDSGRPTKEVKEIQFSGWRLNMDTHELSSPMKSFIHLTDNEFSVLSCLARNSNQAISRDDLRKEMGGKRGLPDDRIIDNTISRIRRKVEYDSSRPKFIATVRGVGYRFVPKTELS